MIKIIRSALNGDYVVAIIDGKINIGMRFYHIELELILPEFQLTVKAKLLSRTAFEFSK